VKISNYKRTIFSWSIYDFANQPFTTITITFIYSVFFAEYIFLGADFTGEGLDRKLRISEGVAAWGIAVTISSVIVALLSPIMGAIADRGGYRKIFLIFWTWVCIIFSFCLYYPIGGDVFYALLFFCLANIGFEMGGVFLNAYLPEIAPKEKIGRISGYGWSFGYFGGLIALAICYTLFATPDSIFYNKLDNSTGEQYRIINIFIAIWFAVFSIPTFLYVNGKKQVNSNSKKLISNSFIAIKNTFSEIKKYKQVTRFLIARIIYNDAIITVIAFGGQYASTQFGFNMENGLLMIFAIVLNVFAGVGSFLFGFLDDFIGGKKTIQITNIGFIIAIIIAFAAPLFKDSFSFSNTISNGEIYFWISGVMIGIFLGPNQSASRSLMGRLIPKHKENEFYGFFAFSGKATAFLGPLIFTSIVSYTKDIRLAMLMLAVLFVFGALLLRRVNTEEGIEIAQKG